MTIETAQVGHAGGQHDAGWFVKNISITDPVSQTQYTFVCNRWLASDRGDGKTAVEFTPSYRNVLVRQLHCNYHRGSLFL